MNKQAILFILSLLTILILFSLQTQKTITGTIKDINYKNKYITLTLNNTNHSFIIFTNKILPLETGQQIKIYGREEKYKNKKQIIVNKLISSV